MRVLMLSRPRLAAKTLYLHMVSYNIQKYIQKRRRKADDIHVGTERVKKSISLRKKCQRKRDFIFYWQQERMEQERTRRRCPHHWCLSLLQKKDSNSIRKVQECQKHPCRPECLTSIRWSSKNIESIDSQSYPEDTEEMVTVPDIVFTRASSLASGGRTPRRGSLNP